jgi:glycosyltransferase 2 family protein
MKLQFDAHDRSSRRRILRFVLFAMIIGVGVSILLSLLADRGQYFASLRKVRVVYFIVPLALFILSYVVDALRLMMVLSQFKIRLSFLRAFYNSAVGNFFLNVTPMSSGGQPFQIYHLGAVGVPLETATNVIMSRFVEQALTSMLIALLSLTQISWIASSLGVGSRLIYVAMGVTFLMTVALIVFLLRPHLVGRLALALEKTFVGRGVARLSGRHNWARSLYRWSHRLRTNVRLLWAEKTPVMIADILMGVVNIVLHAWSLQYVLQGVTGKTLSVGMVIITYVILWQIVFYVPTPGASGGVEGAFTMV